MWPKPKQPPFKRAEKSYSYRLAKQDSHVQTTAIAHKNSPLGSGIHQRHKSSLHCMPVHALISQTTHVHQSSISRAWPGRGQLIKYPYDCHMTPTLHIYMVASHIHGNERLAQKNLTHALTGLSVPCFPSLLLLVFSFLLLLLLVFSVKRQ